MAMPKVFISYAREQLALVDQYTEAIKTAGIEVWRDNEQINYGQSIVERLNEALNECTAAVVFYSAHYALKAWTNAEMQALTYMFIESSKTGRQKRSLFVLKTDNTELPALLSHYLWRGVSTPAAIATALLAGLNGPVVPPSVVPPKTDAEWGDWQDPDVLLNQLDGPRLEMLATKIIKSHTQVPSQDESIVRFMATGVGEWLIKLMPAEVVLTVVDDIRALLDQANIHLRYIRGFQEDLAIDALGVFKEGFKMQLEKRLGFLDKVRFGEYGLQTSVSSILQAVRKKR